MSDKLFGMDVEGSGRGLILRYYYPGTCLEGLRNRRKPSVRIAGLLAEKLNKEE
jgi:hypothetical protein